MNGKPWMSVFFAILAAALYALNAPFSKLLLEKIPSTLMAGFLYLGAGIGMLILGFFRKNRSGQEAEKPLTRQELPYVIGMVVLDIAAPIFLMMGLSMATAANVSLLNNFEIVATSLIALGIFRETISRKLWIAIGLMTVSSMILSLEDAGSFTFSYGSLFVLLACVCWGFENNCTRMLSSKDPLQIVVIKGICSGLGSLIIGFVLGEKISELLYIPLAMLLGFVAYGLSIFFYIYAQRKLGAARTSAYYAVAPFIGSALSLIMFREMPGLQFGIAFLIMAAGAWLAALDTRQSMEPEIP